LKARFSPFAVLAVSLALLSGCASLPPPVAKPQSRAFGKPETSELGKLVRATAPAENLSGFRLLVAGEDAFDALLALVRSAGHTLDLKYYIVRNDDSTRRLLREVHAAAGRGVRVRMLVDDLNSAPSDENLLCLTAHPNIDLRLYNPFPAGRFSTVTRVLSSLTDLARVNRRMHGKMLVADNTLAVTGGRNLGDEYFVRSPANNFVDLDLLAAGPVVPALSASFDEFWNSPLAYPIAQLVTEEPDCAGPMSAESERADEPRQGPPGSPFPDVAATNPELAPGASAAQAPAPAPATAQAGEGLAGARAPDPGSLTEELSVNRLPLTWVEATVLADSPAKIEQPEAARPGDSIAADIADFMGSAQRELVLITPYFVPGPHGMALFRTLRERGVSVKVLTNSLAATDAPIVHIGYARYRPELLELGVELHEMRNQLGSRRRTLRSFGSSLASLHAKAVVVDRQQVLVGSMNMDPRSERLNSEIALRLPSAELAAQILALFEEVTGDSSYRLALTPDEQLRWIDGSPETPDPEGIEPDASLAVRLMLLMLAPFAPEEFL
jgi:putative cardiolipin synthase